MALHLEHTLELGFPHTAHPSLLFTMPLFPHINDLSSLFSPPSIQ